MNGTVEDRENTVEDREKWPRSHFPCAWGRMGGMERHGGHIGVSPRARMIYTAVGGGWLLLHALGLLGPLAEATFVVVGSMAVAGAIHGLRRNEVDRPLPWRLMTAAMVVWLIGGGLREAAGTLGDLTSSRALLPDVFSIAGYVLVGSSLLIVHHRRFGDRGRNLDTVLDASIAGFAVASVVWASILVPTFDAAAPSALVEVLLVTYPVLSVAVASVLLRFALSASGVQVPAHRLLIAAFCLLLVGDAVYMVVELNLVTLPTRVIDMPYGAAFLVIGSAMLHPSIAIADREIVANPVRSNRLRLMVVGAALGVPAMLTLIGGPLETRDRLALASFGVLLTIGAVVRFGRAMSAQAAVQQRLSHAASHDALTELPNRTSLAEHLGRAQDDDRLIGALFADLDRFKLINDGLGHATGDSLLRAVAGRLRENAGPADFIARVGGDEFVVITRADSVAEIEDLAERLRCCLGVPFRIGSSEIHASLSIGVRVLSPDARSEVDTILEDADSALYQAKRRGRNTVVTFDRSMREWADRQLFLEQELNVAVATNQLRVAYQPVVRLPDGALEGFEALVRWDHPDIGPIGPETFIPVAEETGIIVAIGAMVLDEACRQLMEWRRDDVVQQVTMSVNLSPRQFIDHDIVSTVVESMQRHGLCAGALQLEITEGMLTDDPIEARRTLNELRDVGVRISLDDFGTGFSSIAQLKSFPLDTLKIDRSFVNGVGYPEPSSDESLVAAIVAMAGALGFRTIAEGVETDDQAARLFELGVRSAQGFHFSRPVEPADMPRVLGALRQHLPN